MNHIFIGMIGPFALALVLYLLQRCRASLPQLVIAPLMMATFSLWAVAPDIPRLLGKTRFYIELTHDPRCNIFFWHYSIDKVETEALWAFPAVVALLAALLFAAWRELQRAEGS